MNQPKQPTGNFKLNLNYRRKGNAKAPPITGTISTPEDPDVEYSFSAFRHQSEKGEYFIGPVEMNRSVRQALSTDEAPRGSHFVAIRENGFKVFKELPDGAPNPAYDALTAEQQEKEDSKPSYWATWTRTDAEPQLRAAAWEREANRYGPWASGNTQYPLTKEQLAELDMYDQDRYEREMMANTVQPAARRTKAKDDAHTR